MGKVPVTKEPGSEPNPDNTVKANHKATLSLKYIQCKWNTPQQGSCEFTDLPAHNNNLIRSCNLQQFKMQLTHIVKEVQILNLEAK